MVTDLNRLNTHEISDEHSDDKSDNDHPIPPPKVPGHEDENPPRTAEVMAIAVTHYRKPKPCDPEK